MVLEKRFVSDLGVTGGNKKSGYYLNGERQKNASITKILLTNQKQKIRAKVAQQDPKNRIIKESSWLKLLKQFRGNERFAPLLNLHYGKWIEAQVRQVLNNYGYSEVRMPVVESTPLFARAIGEVTDVVFKRNVHILG